MDPARPPRTPPPGCLTPLLGPGASWPAGRADRISGSVLHQVGHVGLVVVDVVRHRHDDGVAPEQQPALEDQRRLVVQQLLPPPA